MSSIVEVSQPSAEPISLAIVKKFLRLTIDTDDELLQTFIIPGARRQLENALGITLANRKFTQYEDGFPFFPYYQSPYAPLFGAAFPFYFGYGPVTSGMGGLQNQMVSPFEIRLLRGPVTEIQKVVYIGTDGDPHELTAGTDFVSDYAKIPPRLAPIPGQRWPVSVIGMNTVQIFFSAGYLPNEGDAENSEDILVPAPHPPEQPTEYQQQIGIPPNFYIALLQLVTHWYQNRDPVIAQAGAGGHFAALPLHVEEIISSERIWDFGLNR